MRKPLLWTLMLGVVPFFAILVLWDRVRPRRQRA
jgi:hypothetical protein